MRSDAKAELDEKEEISHTGSIQEDDDRHGAPELLEAFNGLGGSAVEKTSQADSFLTGGLRSDAKAELDEKEEISHTGSIQEDDDRHGAPELLEAFNGLGGSAVEKTSQADSFLTGGLRSDAKAELDEKEEISHTGSIQEDDDRHGAPELVEAFNGLGGSAVEKTSQADSFLTGGLRSDAKAELDEKEEISHTGSIQEDDDRHGAPELLEAFNGLGGSAVEKTSQADSFLTGGLRSDAKAELDEKEEISHTGSIQEDDDRHGAPELVEAFNGLGGSAVEKTSQADSFLTGGLRSDAKAELDEKEEISHTGSIQEDDDRHGAPELVEAFNGLGGSAVEKTSQADSFLTGGLRSDAKAELDEKEEISHTGSIQEDDDRHGAPELLEAFNGLGGSAVEQDVAGRLIPHGWVEVRRKGRAR